MKTKLSLFFLILALSPLPSALSQIPQGFNYQAIARDGSGNPIVSQSLPARITIQADSLGTSVIWQEIHSTVTSNSFGLISLVLGKGARQSASTVATFSAIDWSVTPKFIKTEIYYTGSYKTMGVSRLWSVPYALTAQNLTGTGKLGIKGTTTSLEEAIFEVKNKDGQTIFAVYNEGVRIYVDDGAKGPKGGFAVGGFGTDKAGTQKYLFVTGDSIRMYIDESAKASKGGFAVGGFDQTKGNANFLNIATDEGGIINPSQNRVLWYPIKNAFLIGRVLIESPDSVGQNSFVSGFESQASGDWSQAMGFKTAARGDYSTSIGKNSNANGTNSFAFGSEAIAKGEDSYAFGTGALATGKNSFALGSSRLNDSTGTIVHTVASAEGAFALGFGSVASALGGFAIGVLDTASAPGSLAMGYFNRSKAWFSTTIGAGNIVETAGYQGLATGILTKAGNWAASSFGDRTYASGHTSFATGFTTVASGQLSSTFGDQTIAQSYGSMAIGRYNVATGTPGTWNSSEPVFAIGNGTSPTSRSNALTVYKNGNLDVSGISYLNNSVVSSDRVEVNTNGSGNRYAYIDLVGDDTYSNYGLRIFRSATGPNAYSEIYHRGTGLFYITTQEYAPILLVTNSSERMRINANGYVGIKTTSPAFQLDVAGSANLNKGISGLGALFVDGDETIWYNGTYFSWGYGGSYNYFADKVTIGNPASSGYALYVQGAAYAVSGWATSDIRWKKDLEPLRSTLPVVLRLQGFNYTWRYDEYPDMNFDKERQIGLIAQDVEKVIPEIVKTDDNGYKAISYEKLTVILLESIKEQQKQIESTRQENQQLKSELQLLREEMEQIKTMLAKGDTK